MKRFTLSFTLVALLVALLAACGQDSGAGLETLARRCYPFDVSVGGPFSVQPLPVYTTPEAEIYVRPYQEGGAWYFGGELRQQNSNMAAGTAPELIPSWARMSVVPNQPLAHAGFRFGEYYPHNNLEINGAIFEVGYLAALNGQVLNGIQIDVTLDPVQPVGGNTGLLLLTPVAVPDITSFGVGGQETAIDNVCLQN